MEQGSSTRAPTLGEVIRRAINAALVDTHRAIPASVQSYDAKTQQVDCQILVKRPYLDETDERQVESLPVVPNVPVMFAGGGGYRETFPIAAGDTGYLVFAERSLDRWLTGTGAEVDPEFDEASLVDAVFFPGLRPFGAPLQSAPTDRASFGNDTVGAACVESTSTGVNLGANATHPVPLGDNLQQDLSNLNTNGLTILGAQLTLASSDVVLSVLCTQAATALAAAGAAVTASAIALAAALPNLNSLTTKTV